MKVLYIDIDSCRPDHFGCYGYHRNTSPNIDKLAAEGVRFNNYYVSDAPCLPSRTAFYTGMFGIHSGVVGHGGTAADPRIEGAGRGFQNKYEMHSLASALRERGIFTAQISPFGQRHAAHIFYSGFQEIHNTGRFGMESAEEIQPTVMKWLSDHAANRENWYLHVNYWDPHTPFRVPLDYGDPFADDPLPEWLTDEVLEGHKAMAGPHCSQEISGMYSDSTSGRYPREVSSLKSRDDLRRQINGYDTAIRYVDDKIGEIVEKLRELGIFDDVTIIISADHGENQGELGIYSEHATADHATCRVPFIVKGPAIRKGEVKNGLYYHLDTAPTLTELAGGQPKPTWDGRSFASALKDGADPGREFLVLSQCAHVCQRSVRFGEWLYIRTYHDGFHVNFDREMLFNIEQDPHEQINLARHHPEVCNQALRYLTDWHDAMMASMESAVDPLWTVMHEGGPAHARAHALKSYVPYLEQTGRSWAVPVLRDRHPRAMKEAGW